MNALYRLSVQLLKPYWVHMVNKSKEPIICDFTHKLSALRLSGWLFDN